MIISVINLKGGSGKTTTAMALATAAARHNRNVSVLDTDPQGDATTWAGDAEDAGETLPFTVDSANIGKLKRLRKTMADDELVIIDCPPAGNVVDVACDVADFVIVPATQGPFELSHALETAESLDAAGKPYALLLLKVENNKLAGNAVNLIRERGVTAKADGLQSAEISLSSHRYSQCQQSTRPYPSAWACRKSSATHFPAISMGMKTCISNLRRRSPDGH